MNTLAFPIYDDIAYRITESATKESRVAKRKAKKAIPETNGKTTLQDEKTNRKRTKEGEHAERQTGRGKTNEEKKEIKWN